MKAHHPLKKILNQLKSENHLNKESVLKLFNDPEQLKQIVDQFGDEDHQLEQSIIKALNSIPVPDGLKESILEKIRSREKQTKL